VAGLHSVPLFRVGLAPVEPRGGLPSLQSAEPLLPTVNVEHQLPPRFRSSSYVLLSSPGLALSRE